MTQSTQQRQDHILARIFERGHVAVRDLAGELAVSEATVRRDLRCLSDAGKLQLVYGGAALPLNSDYSFRSKALRNVEAKRVVGRLAAELVADGEQVIASTLGQVGMSHGTFIKERDVSRALFDMRLSHMSPGDFDDWDDFDDPDDGYF